MSVFVFMIFWTFLILTALTSFNTGCFIISYTFYVIGCPKNLDAANFLMFLSHYLIEEFCAGIQGEENCTILLVTTAFEPPSLAMPLSYAMTVFGINKVWVHLNLQQYLFIQISFFFLLQTLMWICRNSICILNANKSNVTILINIEMTRVWLFFLNFQNDQWRKITFM